MLRPIVRKPPKARKILPRGTVVEQPFVISICQKCYGHGRWASVQMASFPAMRWQSLCPTCLSKWQAANPH